MKTIILSCILFIAGLPAISQCDKKVTWYATKGEMYDANGSLLDTKTDSIFLETDPQKITLRFKSDNKALEGVVKEKTCDWKEPFRNGKSVYHATVSIDGVDSNASFIVEARDQKITLSVEIDARKDRKFLIYIDKHQEQK